MAFDGGAVQLAPGAICAIGAVGGMGCGMACGASMGCWAVQPAGGGTSKPVRRGGAGGIGGGGGGCSGAIMAIGGGASEARKLDACIEGGATAQKHAGAVLTAGSASSGSKLAPSPMPAEFASPVELALMRRASSSRAARAAPAGSIATHVAAVRFRYTS